MELVRLETVDAFIAFDLDGARINAGGTRLAPDVTEHEAALLARAMTYKFAVLGRRIGGAKAGIRADPSDAAARDDAMARFCAEIRPMVDSRRFLTGPDLGTAEHDFLALRDLVATPSAMTSTVDGASFEDVVTGFGVAAAADAAAGGLDGRRVAIEGFGKVGGGVAREVVRRGGRVVAVSTLTGCVHDPAGLDVEALWAARREHGDRCVEAVGLEVRPPAALFDVEADVVVPGARTGVVDEARAGSLRVSAVVPAANVPYTEGGLRVLVERGIAAHADFVCNAGGVMGFQAATDATPAEVLGAVGDRITALTTEASAHPGGPFAGACAIAERFLRTWRDEPGMPPGPPLA